MMVVNHVAEVGPCQAVNDLMSTQAVSCGCTILGFMDIANTGGHLGEALDCGCNIMQTLVNACNHGAADVHTILQGLATVADCFSLAIAPPIGAAIGGAFSGGNPFVASATAALTEPFLDAGIYMAQNYINSGSVVPELGMCDGLSYLGINF